MDIDGEVRIGSERQRVWEALNDPEVLRACLPGCQSLARTSENSFDAIVATRVGPISATFRGAVELSELDPPNGYTLTGRGQGGAAGFAKLAARVSLRDDGNDTLLAYTAQADIGGKLASVGSRLMHTVAKKNVDEFFAAFSRTLAGQDSTPPPLIGTRSTTEATPATNASPLAKHAISHIPTTDKRGLGALVPAWLVVFGTGLGIALGYCVGMLIAAR
jgi:carbon monoxide dehydrogenase subunit G